MTASILGSYERTQLLFYELFCGSALENKFLPTSSSFAVIIKVLYILARAQSWYQPEVKPNTLLSKKDMDEWICVGFHFRFGNQHFPFCMQSAQKQL